MTRTRTQPLLKTERTLRNADIHTHGSDLLAPRSTPGGRDESTTQ